MKSKCYECKFNERCSRGDVSDAHYDDYIYRSDRMCYSYCPTGFYCTRDKYHDGSHQAGIGPHRIIALWGCDSIEDNMSRVF